MNCMKLFLTFVDIQKLEIFGKGRIFHHEGMLALSNNGNMKKTLKFKDTMCFLFNDILLVTTKKKSAKYEAIYQIPLDMAVLNPQLEGELFLLKTTIHPSFIQEVNLLDYQIVYFA